MQMIWAYLFALATPLVLWAVTRMPIERDNWVRNALLHIPISIVLSVLLTALGRVLIWLRWGWPMGRPLTFESVIRFVIANFTEAIGIYLLIALTGYAFSYYRRYREGQVKNATTRGPTLTGSTAGTQDAASSSFPLQHPPFNLRSTQQRRRGGPQNDHAAGRFSATYAGKLRLPGGNTADKRWNFSVVTLKSNASVFRIVW